MTMTDGRIFEHICGTTVLEHADGTLEGWPSGGAHPQKHPRLVAAVADDPAPPPAPRPAPAPPQRRAPDPSPAPVANRPPERTSRPIGVGRRVS